MHTAITPEQSVQRCLDAYNKACAQNGARDEYSDDSADRVNRAYRRAMPFLTPATIDAFLACVTHGLVLEIFTIAEAAKLLYATQIAVGSRRANQQSKSPQPQVAPGLQPPPTPLPLGKNGAAGAMAAPQVPPGKNGAEGAGAAPQVPGREVPSKRKEFTEESLDAAQGKINALLEQLQAGKLPPPAKLPPSPLPLG